MSASGLQREALDADLHLLDGDLVVLRVERWTGPLRRPAFAELPGQRRLARLVERRDRAAAPYRLAVHDGLAPGIQILVLRVAALEADVRELLLAGNLADRVVFVAFAVLDDVGLGGEPADFGESRAHAVDL